MKTLARINIFMNQQKGKRNKWVLILFIISGLITNFIPIDIYFKARNYTVAYLVLSVIMLTYLISGTVISYRILSKKMAPLGASLISFFVLLILFLVFDYQYNRRTNAVLDKDGVDWVGIVTSSEKGKNYFKAKYFYEGKEYQTFRERDYSKNLEEQDSIEIRISASKPDVYKIK